MSGEPIKLQVFLDRLNDSEGMFGMRSASSKFKVMLNDWIGSKPNLFLQESNWIRDRLVAWVAVSHVAVVYLIKCIRPCIFPIGIC